MSILSACLKPINDNVRLEVRARARDFVDLHDQVETSVGLLDTLETFLSTFQNDLSSVSGQISDLQARSKDIENRLKSRKVRAALYLLDDIY